MNDSRFKRRYVLMEDPNPSFSQGSGIKGLAKFETTGNKGFLRISIQNLLKKPDMAYHVYLVGANANHKENQTPLFLVKMGTLISDNPGCYSYSGSFSPLNLDGEGHQLAAFHSVLVAAETFQKKKIPILRGHLQTKAFPITYEMLNPDPYEENRKTYCSQVLKNIHRYEKTSPFGDASNPYIWNKIESIDDYPLKELDPWLFDSVNRYHHYLLGSLPLSAGDVPHFWLIATPGKKSQGEHLENFFFLPLFGAPTETDEYGYHICAVDFLSGRILSPTYKEHWPNPQIPAY